MHFISFKLSKQETDRFKVLLDYIGFDKKKDELWVLKIDKHLKAYLLNNKFPLLFEKDNCIFPTVIAAKTFEGYYSEAMVDQGAKPHILNGADLMAPGILSIDLKDSSNIVIIKSEDGAVLAVGRLVKDFIDSLNRKHGKVAENIHYLNDKLYRLLALRRGS